jgi:hypothetical protein
MFLGESVLELLEQNGCLGEYLLIFGIIVGLNGESDYTVG